MANRKTFLKTSALACLSLMAGCSNGARPSSRLKSLVANNSFKKSEDLASDENFWRQVRKEFDLKSGLINLNHGLSPAPKGVMEKFQTDFDSENQAPTFHTNDWPNNNRNEQARNVAAQAMGCDPEELAITRSGTESLKIAQLGIELNPGDEVLTTSEDYWTMWNVWQQRVNREGIVYREIDFGLSYPSPQEIVSHFERAITPRTRVILFCHLTWRTGHILPVREICKVAKSHGIQTIVDGAHAFGHIPYRVDELGCDYYGTSGHKWLQAPLGTGLLYVRKERISSLWPPATSWNGGELKNNIRKFEVYGSRPSAFHNAIEDAVNFLGLLGVKRKNDRLRYLTHRWAKRLASHPRVHVVTDLNPGRSCGIGSFYVEGIHSSTLVEHLLDRHGILVSSPGEGSYDGPSLVRITPNVFTSAKEIDIFTETIENVLQIGLH